MSWPFKRKPRSEATAAPGDTYTPTDNGYRPPVPEKAAPVGLVPAIGKLLPIGRIVDQLAGIIRDPNGKLSSKRAGAGALIMAGLSFMADGRLWEAIICLVFATLLFALTKVGNDQEPKA